MSENGNGDFKGPHDQDPLGSLLEAAGLVKSSSMDVSNDPRFFTDNVLNYRLAAFSGLSVVSGLMIQNAMDHIFDMDKRMNFGTIGGICQAIAFFLLMLVLFLNTIATYVGVAQPYHAVRLMTSGAQGFEAATTYYLNKSVTVYRHLAVKAMLGSLPLFMMQSGLRLVVKFKRGNSDEDPKGLSAFESRCMGGGAAIIMITMGLFIFYMDYKHRMVFIERYALMSTDPAMTAHMLEKMAPMAAAAGREDAKQRVRRVYAV